MTPRHAGIRRYRAELTVAVVVLVVLGIYAAMVAGWIG